MHVLAVEMAVRAVDVEAQARLLRALAHPIRLRLLEELSREEECVCHLAALFGRPQPYLSQQLAALKEVGLAVDRRDGQCVFYRPADARVGVLLEAVRTAVGGSAPSPRRRDQLPDCPCPKCA